MPIPRPTRDWRGDLRFHLRILAQRGQPATVDLLAEILGGDRSSIAHYLHGMIRDGLVERHRTPGCGRAWHYQLVDHDRTPDRRDPIHGNESEASTADVIARMGYRP